MPFEIERKFLVHKDKLPKLLSGSHIVQGYIPTASGTSVRVRVAGDKGYLTIKKRSSALTRREYEFPIPAQQAQEMLQQFCNGAVLRKERHVIPYRGMNWELDVFAEPNTGLIVAEIELEAEDQHIDLPDWVAEEVTLDERYSNSSLVINPYNNW